MEVSIIIVNWNTRVMLRDCLSSIFQSKDGNEGKIIVVDNASKDGSVEMVRELFPSVILIQAGGNLGFGKANNLAIPQAEGEFILFLNPDTIVRNGSIKQMISFMKDHREVGALGCKLVYPDGRIQNLGLQWFPTPLTEFISLLAVTERTKTRLKAFLPFHDPMVSGYVKKIYGGCLMVRKAVLGEIGRFDERFFMYGEDVDLCRRIYESGRQLFYLSEAEIIHLVGGASRKSTSQFSILVKCESMSRLMEKYYGKKGLVFYKLAIFTGSQVRLLTLGLIKLLTLIPSVRTNLNFGEACNKYKAMVKWSLNLQKPVVKD